MCGIAGIVDLKGKREIDPSTLKRMTDAIAHRGPDGEGFFLTPGIGLGHRRLAIIDLEGGDQPFTANNNSGTLSFNGEIYNYTGLGRDLVANGIGLKTRSDTEVLAEGLSRYGTPFIDQLRGIFAFAWWNERQQALSLVRDRLGERPLYYAETPDGFLLFASEINAIIASGMMPLDLCPEAVCDYFHFGYVPDPKSIYHGIKKLPPGSILTIKADGRQSLTSYWAPDFAPNDGLSYERAQEELLELLDEAVRLQMMSDVPLGAFLSGGVDSSAIIAAMSQSTEQITSCSIGFNEDSHDERAYARAVAKQFTTNHLEEIADLAALQDIDKIAQTYGEPFADVSALPTYAVCRLAKKHVTVALSGDGGDEIFAGYRRYPFFKTEERARSLLPLSLRRATFGPLGALYPKLDWAPKPFRFKTTFQSLGESRAEAYLRTAGANLPDRARLMMSGDLNGTLNGYCSSTVMEAAFNGEHENSPVIAAQKADLATWLPGRMLTKVDRASMAHSLEARPPLLDHKLVEWAARLPASFKIGPAGGGTTGKRILKSAHQNRLSRDILYRPKQGFGIPVAAWLRDKNGPLDRLRASNAWSQSGLIGSANVETMMDKHQRHQQDFSQELWSVVMFDAFLRTSNKLSKV